MNLALGSVVVASLACGGGDPPPAVPPPAPARVVAAPVAAPPIEPVPVAAPPGPIWATPEPDVGAVLALCGIAKPDGTFWGGESATMDFEYSYDGTWKLEGERLTFSGRKTGRWWEDVEKGGETELVDHPVDEPFERVLTGVGAYRRGDDAFLMWTVPEGAPTAGTRASRWCRKDEDIPYAHGWYENVGEVHHVVLYDAVGSRDAVDAAARAIAGLPCPYACFATIDGGTAPPAAGVRVTHNGGEGTSELMEGLRSRFDGVEEVKGSLPDPIVVVVGSSPRP